ncbi:MAG TPA: PA14 domain-containing protein [Methylomirabilota bacterium]|nr:PA14 domain-containing protein [Methylomirabilota bacterium]
MKQNLSGWGGLLLGTTLSLAAAPISLHPDNPHYFLWRGKPTFLLTSGEHYGAVVNLDFDFRRYLDTLAADGLNNTRTFSGTYLEPEGAFNIARNTLAPATGRFICPWARSDQPGFAAGGNKFDLTRWDEAYFARLREFVAYADQKGVVVEFTFFCPMYEDKQWRLSPMNAQNNVNGLGAIGRNDVHTLDRNGGLLAVQEALTRKLVTELNPFDNVMFEICNEPYFGGVTMAWQHHMADVMVETERSLPKKHLITQNIANNQAKIERPHPAVSVFNFHYATPPDTVALNYGLNKVIGDNETGFRGTNNAPYRTEGWDFLLAGGGLYNNLDYSFTVGHEDGTFVYPASQPGGGNPGLRRELRALRDFMAGLDFIRMRPDNSVIKGGVPVGGSARALVQPGKAVAVYIRNEGSTGPWSARWTGFIEAPDDGEYEFHTTSNDGIRLWVDGRKIIEDWTDHSTKEDSGRVTLKAGQRAAVKLEYFYNGGQGITKLAWTPPRGKKESVPANAFRLPDKDAWGLRGEYFHGTDLKNAWATRDDGTINFTWGAKPPFAQTVSTARTELQIELASGHWRAEWHDTKTGQVMKTESFSHAGGVRALAAPAYTEDIALRLSR